MGGNNSKPKTTSAAPKFTTAPVTTSTPCPDTTTSRRPECRPNVEHLLLAFFAGVLLTLLLVALVFLIIRSCRKRHFSAQALEPLSDPHLAKRMSLPKPACHPQLSPPEDELTYASMTFKIQEGKSASSSMYHSASSDPSIYAQIKATDSPHLAKKT
ncbi:PREDICTED: transmembrane protein C1orf162 homolog [Condylura cristata]|uniref:transmembrane protein C1orf162 homolog n=1 Tax=Condylura cristata TaxID=143302 RepID=UPI000643B75D|nr:PREDICTED: transmembrane protein C1orf162 homolog [Condylura cristata]